MATATKTVTTVVTSAANTAGSTTRGTVDLRTALGGIVTFKMTNGGTGPTIQCTAAVLVAHDTGTTPAAGSEGATWKTVAGPFGNGTAVNTITPFSYTFGPEVMHLEVEFTGNTGQSVTVEAVVSIFASIA
jgi:hypothetical protein